MNDEQLSALMDDELAADASRDAVTNLLAESESRATWGRYHLIGAALRSAPATRTSAPNKVVALPSPAPRVMSRIGLGLAAAATLAAMALIVSPNLPQESSPPALAANPITQPTTKNTGQGSSVVTPAPNRDAVAFVNQTFIVRGDQTQQRMNSYVRNFNEQRARQPTPGVHPYVRIVGYETH